MDEILKTTLLEYGKSAFLIELVKHQNGKQYIQILQTIQEEESERMRAIKINPSIVSDLVKVLNSYQELIPSIPKKQPIITNNTTKLLYPINLTEAQKSAIQMHYLKGVSIADLTIQFDCDQELIKQILNNNGIVILDNQLPPKNNYKRFRRRK